jgi:signal transduction histidine kinase/Tfp pilus assembly protein PilF
VKLTCTSQIRFRGFFLALFPCFLAACNHAGKHAVNEKEIDILALTDRMAIVNRPKMLQYADSLFRAQKNKTVYCKAGWLMAYANYYDFTGNFERARPYADSAIAIIDRQKLEDSVWTRYYFAAHMKEANIFYKTGDYPQAIEGYFRIKVLAERPGNRCTIGVQLHNNIGLILYRQQKYQAAGRFFKEALGILNSCSAEASVNTLKTTIEQQIIDNIGQSFAKTGRNDSALVYYHKALYVIGSGKFSADPVQDKVSRAVSRGVVLSNIGEIFLKENKLDSAELYFKENITINAVTYKNEIRNAQHSQLSLAQLYRQRKDYADMKATLGDLRKCLDTVPNSEAELGWRKLMAGYSADINQPLLELEYYKSYISMRDSFDHLKTAFSQADINRELGGKQGELDNIILQQDNQLSHLYLWITVSLSLMALVIVGLVYYYYKKGKKNIRSLLLLNSEIGEQRDRLEFATVELGKSNAEKERILRVVAHDLRDPIGGAATLVNMVINEDLPREFEVQNLNLVEKTLGNSMALINELLVFDPDPARLLLELALADIHEIARQCVGLMQLIAAKKDQKITLLLPEEPLIIDLDKARIERMLNNLLGNAIKFSLVGQTIIVEIKKGKNDVLIMVKDNGIGIPAPMQGELFNTFSNTRRMGTAGERSFGLGLSICKQIVEAHGGKIWVESVSGKGSAFFVELPLGSN